MHLVQGEPIDHIVQDTQNILITEKMATHRNSWLRAGSWGCPAHHALDKEGCGYPGYLQWYVCFTLGCNRRFGRASGGVLEIRCCVWVGNLMMSPGEDEHWRSDWTG